mmetsp:Transcript_19410/g.36229  ORF Transcript_19410/g.36229 Transcript_19410/m.36229 type:complete len:275 (-) Transcript_19410:471-1295(-)
MIHSFIVGNTDHSLLYGRICCCEQIGPNLLNVTSWDTSTFVANFNDDIFIVTTIGNNDLDGWKVSVRSVPFNGGSHTIFQQFQHDVMQMGRNVREGQIQPTTHDNFRGVTVFPCTHKGRVVNGSFDNFVRRRDAANDTDVMIDGWLSQGQVLSNQDSNADTAQIKSIQKVVRFFHFGKDVLGVHTVFGNMISKFKRSPCHLYQNSRVAFVNPFDQSGKFGFAFGGTYFLFVFDQFQKGLNVQLFDFLDGLHILHERDLFQILNPMCQSDGQFAT